MNIGQKNENKKQLFKLIQEKKKQFITSLTVLINACYFKNKNNEIMLDIKESFASFKTFAEDIIINQVGQYVWKYRDQIKNLDDNFFLNNNFNNEIISYYKKNPNEDRFTQKEVNEIFNILKNTYPRLNEGEKKTIWSSIKKLLSSYSEFLLYKNKLKQLK